jgi:transcriptional regulator with XRE-family HTH domain
MVKLAEKPAMVGTESFRAVDIDRHVSRRIRERRMMLGLTTRQMAELIGVTYSQAQKYETGVNRIAAGRLYGFAQVLGVDINYFFEDSLSSEQSSMATPQQSMLLELARNFVSIPTSKHQEAIVALARALSMLDKPAGREAGRVQGSIPQGRVPLPRGETVALRPLALADLADEDWDQPNTLSLTTPVKFITKLMDTWVLERKDATKLLGLEQEDDFLELVSGTAPLRTRDIKDRVRHLLRMREALHSLFRDVHAEREWLREPRPELDDQSPLALLLEGPVENFLVVSQFVQRMAGR